MIEEMSHPIQVALWSVVLTVLIICLFNSGGRGPTDSSQ